MARQMPVRFLLSLCMVLGLWITGVFSSTAYSEEVIEVHYFTWATGMSDRYIKEDLIAPFEALYPNIKVIHEPVSGNEFWDKLPTLIAAGLTPDLIHMSVGYVHEYAQKGLLTNLQPYFDRDLDENDFFMEPMKAMRYPNQENGDLYGMPYAFVMTALFYNKDMFDAMGVPYPNETWTWDDLRDAARRLTVDKNGDGIPDQYGFLVNPHYELLDPIVRAYGGRMLNEELTEVEYDSPEGVAATQFLVDMIHEDGSAIRGGRGEFVTQKAAMWVAGMYAMDLGDQVSFAWDVAMMPIGPAERVVRLWPDSFAIPEDAKHKEAAWEYIKYVVSRTEMDRYSGERKVPINKALATSREWLEPGRTPNKMVFIESIPYGDPLEFRPLWGEWEPIRWTNLSPAFKGEESVANAVIKAARAMQVIVDKSNQ